jgi:hypothetical protein
MCLQFGFVIFWQKDFGAKAAHKMLVKLTPGVNFMSTSWEEKFHREKFVQNLGERRNFAR